MRFHTPVRGSKGACRGDESWQAPLCLRGLASQGLQAQGNLIKALNSPHLGKIVDSGSLCVCARTCMPYVWVLERLNGLEAPMQEDTLHISGRSSSWTDREAVSIVHADFKRKVLGA